MRTGRGWPLNRQKNGIACGKLARQMVPSFTWCVRAAMRAMFVCKRRVSDSPRGARAWWFPGMKNRQQLGDHGSPPPRRSSNGLSPGLWRTAPRVSAGQGGPHVGGPPRGCGCPGGCRCHAKGATPPRAASRWRLSVPHVGRSSRSWRAQTGPRPAHGGALLALTPDRTRAQGGVQVVVERREALIEPGARPLDIGLERRGARPRRCCSAVRCRPMGRRAKRARSSSVACRAVAVGLHLGNVGRRAGRRPLAWRLAPWRGQPRARRGVTTTRPAVPAQLTRPWSRGPGLMSWGRSWSRPRRGRCPRVTGSRPSGPSGGGGPYPIALWRHHY